MVSGNAARPSYPGLPMMALPAMCSRIIIECCATVLGVSDDKRNRRRASGGELARFSVSDLVIPSVKCS